MRPRTIGALAIGLCLTITALGVAAEEPRGNPSEPPHYESPIISLLFLPVTLLLKIAEVVSPEPEASSAGTKAAPAAK